MFGGWSLPTRNVPLVFSTWHLIWSSQQPCDVGAIISSFHRGGNWGTERSISLHKVTQSSRVWVPVAGALPLRPAPLCLVCLATPGAEGRKEAGGRQAQGWWAQLLWTSGRVWMKRRAIWALVSTHFLCDLGCAISTLRSIISSVLASSLKVQGLRLLSLLLTQGALVWALARELNQGCGLPSGHARLWELDRKEGRTPKNWCLRTVVLEKTPKSPSDRKEMKPVNPKGNQPWILIGRTDAEAEALVIEHLMWTANTLKKSLMLGKFEGRRKRGHQRTDGWMASLMQWTWT